MLERFTERARTVVERAVRVAGDDGADRVRPEHVLAGLLADDGSLAVQVLGGLGAPLDDLRRVCDGLRRGRVDGLDDADAEALRVLGIDLDEVVRRIETDLGAGRGSGQEPAPPERRRGHIRFAKPSKKALEYALREALNLGDPFIGTEHLLVGLARSGDEVVLGTLAAFDLTADDVRAAVAAAERRQTG